MKIMLPRLASNTTTDGLSARFLSHQKKAVLDLALNIVCKDRPRRNTGCGLPLRAWTPKMRYQVARACLALLAKGCLTEGKRTHGDVCAQHHPVFLQLKLTRRWQGLTYFSI